MKKLILTLFSMLILTGAAGCAQTVEAGVLKSDKPRVTEISISDNDMETLVDGNNEFAFRLYQVLGESEGNLFYSPFSVSEALAMTWAGASGTTELAMADALNFYLSQDDLHAAFNNLDLLLESRGEGAEGMDGEGFRLNVVNAIWGQEDFTFADAFLDKLAENYGAGLRILDFINETESSRQTINEWVEEQTEDRIKDLLPEGSIDSMTRLVLTNAIYFNAAWANQFEESAIHDGDFNLADGTTVNVPMMNQTESFQYVAGDGYQAIALPYDGNELSMVIIQPEAEGFEQFDSSLDAATVEEIIDSLSSSRVDLTMPKFEYEYESGLKSALTSLGMGEAFSDNADFSGMTGGKDLFIADVLHKAFVSVDENGTEAAAATGVIMSLTSMPLDPVEMTLDSPFIFLIQDNETGAILFIGRIMDPSS